jgi:ribose 5-phosphate isomerase A
MTPDEAKRAAARAALEHLPAEGLIGLGTGSTARLFIEGVAELVRHGRALRGVPTSEASREQAEALGIPLLADEGPWQIEVCVDGADEVSAELDLIKGGGGCQTREKIVSHASRRTIIIVDESKLSRKLGERWAVPVEVVPFGHRATARALGDFGRAELRARDDGPLRTDSGNLIYDVSVGPIDDPRALDAALAAVPGVVESGLFCGRADLVLVATATGVRTLRR